MVSIKLVIGWFVIYTAVAVLLSKKYGSEDSDISVWGPLLTLRSQFGLNLVRKLSKRYKRAWGVWGSIGVISALITSVIAVITVSLSVYGLISQPDAVGIEGPTDMLVIPGVNRFLPLAATPELITALVIAMVIHEGGHAIYCVLGDIEIESTGLIFGGLIPLGAFVEPDEEEQNEAETMDQLKMYAAGIMNNYAMFFITLALVFILVPMLVSPITGVGIGSVIDNSPADNGGLEAGDVITEVNGEPIENPRDVVNATGGSDVNQVKTDDGDVYEVPSGAFVTQATEASGIEVGKTVVRVNNVSVQSSHEFKSVLSDQDDSTVEVEYQDGTTSDVRVGVHVTAKEDSGFATQLGLSRGETTIVDSIAGEKVVNPSDFTDVMNDNRGETVEISYWTQDGNLSTIEYDVEGVEFGAITMAQQTSGITTSDLGVNIFPKDRYYNVLSFGDDIGSTLSNAYTAMILPISSIIPGVSFGLPGFTPFVQNFYTVPFAGSIVSAIVFFFISVCFWTAWINVNLAIFNCLPTFALDGGHIVNAIVWSLPFDLSDRAEKYIILSIKSIVLLPLILLLLGPLYF